MENNKVNDAPDAVLAQVGDWGRYQIVLLVLFSLVNILAAFHYFGQTFISIEGRNHCNDSMEICGNATNTFYYQDITELEPWAKDGWIPAVGQSVFFAGSVSGSILIGLLADKVGRRHALTLALLLAGSGNLLSSLSSGPTLFLIGRFVGGTASDSNFVMMYILVVEYVRPNFRTFALHICIGLFYGSACVILPWVALAAKTWKYFLFIVAAPHFTAPLLYFFLPESNHWLLSHGRTEDAKVYYEKVAKINKRQIDDSILINLQNYVDGHIKAVENKTTTILDLFRTPKLRLKMSILIFKSMVMTLCYDAIARDINNVQSSPFIVFSITSVTIIPACIIVIVAQDNLGRKALASGSLATTGLFMFGVAISSSVPQDYTIQWVTIAMLAAARLSVTVAYNSGAQYAVELIPARGRGVGVSLVHLVGYAASAGSGPLLHIGQKWPIAPSLTLAFGAICAAIACLWLPETCGKPLPITLEDGEVFGNNEHPCEFFCCALKTRNVSELPLDRNCK